MDASSEIMLDAILEYSDNELQAVSDAITYVIGSQHTSWNFLAFLVYYMALYPDIQEKVYEEIVKNLQDGDLSAENINALKYCRQVQDECLRCAGIASFAARTQQEDCVIDKYVIPKGTPVIQALAISLKDPKYYPDPDRFDPDRFSEENSRDRPQFAFQPFGFAGKRKCPGFRFSYMEATALMAVLCRKFRLRLAPGQKEVNIVPGFVSKPEDEIWITVEPRA